LPQQARQRVVASLELLVLQGNDVPLDGRAVIVKNQAQTSQQWPQGHQPAARYSRPGDVIRLVLPQEIAAFAAYRRTMDLVIDGLKPGPRPWKAKLAVLAASTIFSAAAAMPSVAGDDGVLSPSTQTPIKHVIVIFGENISFDHYFGTYPFAENPKLQPAEPRFVASDDTHPPIPCSQPGC
jgi:hypothetical protein